jgi:mono/diheme cytochrome c family protein
MRTITFVATILATLGSVAAAYAAPAPAGAAVWEKNCLKCHGVDAKGNAKTSKMLKIDMKLLDLTTPATVGKTDAELRKLIEEGREKMPGYKKDKLLTDTEIGDSLTHMRTLIGTPAP